MAEINGLTQAGVGTEPVTSNDIEEDKVDSDNPLSEGKIDGEDDANLDDNGGEQGDDGEDDEDDDLSLGGSEDSGDEMEFDAGAEADDDDDEDEPARKRPKQSSETEVTPSGWADAMSKILSSDKAILSKAKKDKDVVMKKSTKKKKDDAELEVVGGGEGGEEEEEENKSGGKTKKEKKKVDSSLKASHYGRTKPHLFEKQFERSLSRIATRGVIQLFNAVSKHQKETKDKIKKEGKSEFKKDAILKSVTKGDFIDLLKDTNTVNKRVDKEKEKRKEKKTEESTSQQLPVTESTWKILRDDFMMTKGKSMKDWDKESDSD